MSDPISRLSAALADRYRIEEEIGAGGMATVHLARDLKHDRDVAIKVLRPELSAALGPDRFLKEIEVTARLQHPGILPLFDSGEADGLLYYVMPFIRGETLRARLDREGALEISTALEIAREVGQALDFAHREGVIHRDVKPGNILLIEDRALVADFGIALALEEAAAGRLTGTGLSVGTPTYMSPEQAAGDGGVDRRADIYSLGCVVYEMLAGEPPHTASSPQALVARILSQEPAPVSALRPTVSAELDAAVSRALARNPADRWSTAGELVGALSGVGPAAGGKRERAKRMLVPAALGLLAVGVVAVGYFVSTSMEPGDGLPTMTSEQLTSFLGREHGPSLSPDGSMMAYGHTLEGHSDIFVMSLPEGDPIRLTEHPADDDGPRWSPTGEWIAFLSDRGTGLDVHLVAPTGGRTRKIASTGAHISEDPIVWFLGLGAQPWSPDGRRLLIPQRDSLGTVSIWVLDIESGEQERLTSPPVGSKDMGGSWSPDGSRIVFSRGLFGDSELWMMAADGTDARALPGDRDWSFFPAWTPDGEELVFIGDWNLWTRSLGSGASRPLTTGTNWVFGHSVGPGGEIAYGLTPHVTNLYQGLPGTSPDAHEQLTRDTRDQYGARVSADGRRVVYQSDRRGTMDIWVYDLEADEHLPITGGPAADNMPDWLPDGGFVFASNRGDAGDGVSLWTVAGEGEEPRRFGDGLPPISCGTPYCRKGPNVSPDGEAVGYIAVGEGGHTLWIVDADGSNPRSSGIRAAQSFDWYLDGRRVVYTTTTGDGTGQIELRARHLDTGDDVLLVRRSATEPSVTSDGRGVSFLNAASHYDMNVFHLELSPPADSDGLPRPVGEPESMIDGRGVWHVHNLDWTPEGRFIYTRDEDSGDIFMLRPGEDG